MEGNASQLTNLQDLVAMVTKVVTVFLECQMCLEDQI